MKSYNFFYSIGLSAFSKSFYRQVNQQWRGRSWAYLLVVLLIAWLVIAYFQTRHLCRVANQYASFIIPQLPVIRFEQSIARTDAVEPVYITWPDGEIFAIVDAQNKIKNFSSVEGVILLHRHEYLVRIGKNKIESYGYTIKDQVVKPAEWMKMFHQMKNSLVWIVFFTLFLIGLLLSYFMICLLNLLFSFFAWLIGLLFRRQVTYASVYSLSLVSITPMVGFWTMIDVTRVHLPYRALIYIMLLIAYLLYAVLVQPRKNSR